MPPTRVAIVGTQGGTAAVMTAERSPLGRRHAWLSMMLRVVPDADRVVVTLNRTPGAPADAPVVKVRPLLPADHPERRDTYRAEPAAWDASTRQLTIDARRLQRGVTHSVDVLLWGL